MHCGSKHIAWGGGGGGHMQGKLPNELAGTLPVLEHQLEEYDHAPCNNEQYSQNHVQLYL